MTPRTPRRAAVDPATADPVASPASVSPVTEAGPSSPPPAERSMDAGRPVPEPGSEKSPSRPSPGRGRAQDAGDKEGRDAWKRAQSDWNAGKRRSRFKRAPKATGPGMIRRMPQGGGGDAA